MAYVPGYTHDVFISYAHDDNRGWIERTVDRLDVALRERLGVKAAIWMDGEDLRRSADFTTEIPDTLRSSAILVILASPSYIRSHYCVQVECKLFEQSLPARRARFRSRDLTNGLFALRCPLLPVDDDEHHSLVPGVTDIPFCDEAGTFPVGTPEFESSFRRIVGELSTVLKTMRNNSTPVFLYPAHGAQDVDQAHRVLGSELAAQSYRIVPDREVNIAAQLEDAALAIFLLGAGYDETLDELTAKAAAYPDKPWVVWCSPAAAATRDPTQLAFCDDLQRLNSKSKTFLNAETTVTRLKEEVLTLLRPAPVLAEAQGKPRVYLVYNTRDVAEIRSAGRISRHYRREFHFELPDNPALHTTRLMGSDGVLLVWGSANEDWCSREFAEMVRTSREAASKGLCLFDPREAKHGIVQKIRDNFRQIHIAEQFGPDFDPDRMEGFFEPIRRRGQAPVV